MSVDNIKSIIKLDDTQIMHHFGIARGGNQQEAAH